MPNSHRGGGGHSTHGGDKSAGVNASQSNISNNSGGYHGHNAHDVGRSHANALRSSYNTKESMLSSSGNFPMGLQFGHNLNSSGKLANGQPLTYSCEGLVKAQEVKKQFDAVLDDIKGVVQHVTQREEMKLRQFTGP